MKLRENTEIEGKYGKYGNYGKIWKKGSIGTEISVLICVPQFIYLDPYIILLDAFLYIEVFPSRKLVNSINLQEFF
ncbi:MAG: hypothetical protein PHF18_16690 [Methanosarcina sp.]|uniref:hypothetical protein n=1 Tax=Methanosarcina sp. TaxID=2213 RepID=UPI00260F0E87|nr:hypothetical protein [Methanosarcina sp.]MDD3248469.1 hypothetical protein [Methanosarcina sp.]MDD4248485.1 hypothetical protein [Methanosarcina sp.]